MLSTKYPGIVGASQELAGVESSLLSRGCFTGLILGDLVMTYIVHNYTARLLAWIFILLLGVFLLTWLLVGVPSQ